MTEPKKPAISRAARNRANKPFKKSIKTMVSLNPIMVDGTGMCGGCRVTVDGKIRFACVEGPDFDGHKVDFDELMNRLGRFKEDEKVALDRWLKHQDKCNLMQGTEVKS